MVWESLKDHLFSLRPFRGPLASTQILLRAWILRKSSWGHRVLSPSPALGQQALLELQRKLLESHHPGLLSWGPHS